MSVFAVDAAIIGCDSAVIRRPMICTAPSEPPPPTTHTHLRASAARRRRVLPAAAILTAAARRMRDAHIQTGQLRAQRVEGGRAARLVRALNARAVTALLADVAGQSKPLGGHGAQTGQRFHGHLWEEEGGEGRKNQGDSESER